MDIADWVVTGPGVTKTVTTCAGTSIFGGYGIFGAGAAASRQFTGLPVHNTVRLQMQLWKLDTWDGEYI
jgi:hypothetical protein